MKRWVVSFLFVAGCFTPVREVECDPSRPCGSGWTCVNGQCQPPGNASAGGSANASGGGTGNATGGGSSAATGGGGSAVGGGSATGGSGNAGGGSGTGGSGNATGGGGDTFCPGCVDSSGHCQPGNTNDVCGVSGQNCMTCPFPGSCSSGQCVMSNCNATCIGCCLNDVCVGGFTNQACGESGASCIDCTVNGGFCQAGKCNGNTVCNPSTCAGCCSPNGACHPGTTDQRCGQGGGLCQACSSIDSCIAGSCVQSLDGGNHGPPAIGSACSTGAECRPPMDQFCIQQTQANGSATGFTDGYCTKFCNTLADCMGGAHCEEVTLTGTIEFVCLQGCSNPGIGQDSCRAGYVCAGDVFGNNPSCIPRCDNPGAPACTLGTCDPSTGYCS